MGSRWTCLLRKGIHDTLIEVVQVIEKDEHDVQPAQGEEEGEEEQAKPDAFALVGLHPIPGAFLPVAAVQAVEAAGPDRAAARGFGHGKGLGGGTLGSQRPWQKADPSLPPSEEPSGGGAEVWATAQQRRLQGRLQVPDWRRR